MKQKILFNLSVTQPIGNTKFHGGGKYGLVVFKRLAELGASRVAVYYNDKAYIDEETMAMVREKGMPIYVQSEISLYDAARKESSLIYSPLFASNNVPEDIMVVYTQHGLRVLEMPSDDFQNRYKTDASVLAQLKTKIKSCLHQYYTDKSRNELKRKLLQKNLHIITVSKHSKASLLTFFPEINANKIKVFYSPSTIKEEYESTSTYVNPYGKYYLVVSANRWIKNGYRMLKAMDELFCEHPELEGKVVVTGLSSWKQINIDIKNNNRFILVGYVDEWTLKCLYRHAYLLVYGTLNEGFGYPPLEAMHEGCPVVASAIASVPEVCGEAVLYFNPYLLSEIKMRVLQMEEKALREAYINKGRERLRYIEARQRSDLDCLCHYLLSFLS